MSYSLNILVLTELEYPTNRAMINEFWSKEMSKRNNITIMMQKKVNKFKSIKIHKVDRQIHLIPTINADNLILKGISYSFFLLLFFFHLIKTFKKRKYDIIHIHDFLLGTLMLYFLRNKFNSKISFGWTADFIGIKEYEYHLKNDLSLNSYFTRTRIYLEKLLFKKAIENSDLFCPISKYLENKIKSEYGKGVNSFPIPECGTNLFLSKVNYDNRIQKNTTSKNFLVYVGEIGWERDTEFLIRVLSKVNQKYHDTKLLLIGWEVKKNDFSRLKKYATLLGIRNNIKLIGKIPYSELPGYLRVADIGLSNIPLYPFYLISTPTKTIEYLSLGIPVVANKEIYDQEEILAKSGGGFAVKYDENEFADSIIWLLRHPEEAKGMGKKGREWIKKNRTYELLAEKLEKRYYELVEKQKKDETYKES